MLRAVRFRLFTVLIAILTTACNQNASLRSNLKSTTDIGICDPKDWKAWSEACRHSVREDHDGYRIGFVEFDDQGWLYDHRQIDRLMDSLKMSFRESTKPLVILVFVHGWKHNADFCDSNVTCFRRTLQAVHQKLGQNFTVFGVYVSWRGLSTSGLELWEDASFYDRKNTAAHVALGSVRELFGRLKHFKDTHTDPRARLMIVGHSFGGLIVYSAVSQFMINSSVAYTEDKGAGEYDVVDSFGDLIVLVNPAFEGSRYEPLHWIAAHRHYPPGQQPVFAAFTSRGDSATRKAFPAGRSISESLESYSDSRDQSHTSAEERLANLRTVGHLDRYRTHRLEFEGRSTLAAGAGATPGCDCPYATEIQGLAGSTPASRDDRLLREGEEFNEFTRVWRDLAGGHLKPDWRRHFSNGTVLIHDQATNPENGLPHPENPFWIVTVDPELIDGHNDFYNPKFLGFLLELYDDLIMFPQNPKPPVACAPVAK